MIGLVEIYTKLHAHANGGHHSRHLHENIFACPVHSEWYCANVWRNSWRMEVSWWLTVSHPGVGDKRQKFRNISNQQDCKCTSWNDQWYISILEIHNWPGWTFPRQRTSNPWPSYLRTMESIPVREHGDEQSNLGEPLIDDPGMREEGDNQRWSSRSGSSKTRANPVELDWLGSAPTFLSFEPLARLRLIISKFWA